MARDPWAVVSQQRVEPEADEWAVVSVAPPSGMAVASPTKRSLKERFQDNLAEGSRQSLLGAATDAYAAHLPGSLGEFNREQNRDEAEAYTLRSRADPWYRAPGGIPGKAAAGVATLGGIVAGGVASPESWIGPGKTAAGRVAANAAINAAVDVPIQGLQNEAGTQEGIDPWRVVAAGVTGGLIQGGVEGTRALATAAKPIVDNVVDRLSPRRAAEPTPHLPGDPVSGPGDGWDVVTPPADAPPAKPPQAKAPPKPPQSVMTPKDAAALVQEVLPGAQITSGYRTPAKNKAVGGAPNSYHTRGKGQAVDIVPPAGKSLASFRADLEARGVRVAELIDEGDHWHLAWEGDSPGRTKSPATAPSDLDAIPTRSLDDIPDDAGFIVDWAQEAKAAAAPSPAAKPPEVFPAVAADNPAVSTVSTARLAMAAEPPVPRAEPEAAPRPETAPDAALKSLVQELEEIPGLRLDASVRPNGVMTVSRLVVPEELRNAGIGTRVMGRLRDLSDEHGLTIALSPSGQFGGSVPRLRKFYTRLGFEPNRGPSRDLSISEAMIRRPAGRDPDRLGAIDLSAYDRQTASGANRNLTGLRAAPRLSGVAAQQGEAYSRVSVSQLAARLRKSLGITHRQGRLTLKGGAVGEFDPKTAVVRTKAMQELDVIAHEATHALEFRKKPALIAALGQHADELKKLAYEGANPKHLREEGFAEFGRWYVTNPSHARKIAPEFYDAFEEALSRDDPTVLRDLREIQSAYGNMLRSSSVDVAAGSVAYTGKGGPLTRFKAALDERGLGGVVSALADNAYTWFVDDLHPLNKAVRELQEIYAKNQGQRLDLNAAQNPYALARLSREAFSAGHLDLMEGVVPYRGTDPDSPSLAEALERALGAKAGGKWSKDALSRFDAYLIARRMTHEWDRYGRGELPKPPDKATKEFHEQVIADSEAANPSWADAAQLVYDWNSALWKKRHEAGLITQEAYENGLSAHPDYVPLMRDMSDKRSAPGPSRSRASTQYVGGAKRFEGSTRDVISPLTSMMREAFELNALIKRNDVIRALDDLAEKAGPGSGRLVERLPRHEIERVNVDAIEALTKAAKAAGVSTRDITSLAQAAETALGDASQVALFHQREMSPRAGEAVVFAWRDGKKQPLLLADGEFGQQMFTSISGMNREMSNFLVDTMSAATQLLRAGVTLSPEFMSRNIVRDQLATWINTDVGFVPGYHFAKGAAEQLRGGELARRYQAAGGMRGGAASAALKSAFPKTDVEALKQLQNLRKKGYRIRVYNPLTNPLRGLAAMTDLSESGTRLGVMGLAYKQAKKRGLSDYDAMVEAAFESRDYLDFGRHGAKSLTAVRIVAFLNASLQSLDKAARVLTGSGRERPTLANFRRVLAPLGKGAPRSDAEKRALTHAYKAWAKISALAVFGGTLRALYADDPEYEEIGDKLRATHWFFKANGNWVGIPKPFELAELSNIVERGFEWQVLQDPKAPERMWSDFARVMAPPHDVTALSVPYQIARNRDFSGRPIVPDHLKGQVDPELQFSSYTSELGKLVGRALNVSPAVVDHVVTGFGGSLGRYALQGTNLVNEAVTGKPRTAVGPEDAFLVRGFVRDASRGSNSQKEFWDLMSRDGGEITRAEGTFKAHVKAGDDAKAAAYLKELPPHVREYVTVKTLVGGKLGKANPIARANDAQSVIAAIRREARDGVLVGTNNRPIAMTPAQRRQVDDALEDLAQVEARNALIAAGVPGWANRKFMDRRAIIDRLAEAVPPAASALNARMTQEGVLPIQSAAKMWEQARQLVAGMPEGQQRALMQRARMGSAPARRAEIRRLGAVVPNSAGRPTDRSNQSQNIFNVR